MNPYRHGLTDQLDPEFRAMAVELHEKLECPQIIRFIVVLGFQTDQIVFDDVHQGVVGAVQEFETEIFEHQTN